MGKKYDEMWDDAIVSDGALRDAALFVSRGGATNETYDALARLVDDVLEDFRIIECAERSKLNRSYCAIVDDVLRNAELLGDDVTRHRLGEIISEYERDIGLMIADIDRQKIDLTSKVFDATVSDPKRLLRLCPPKVGFMEEFKRKIFG